jgi:hypothetical protein
VIIREAEQRFLLLFLEKEDFHLGSFLPQSVFSEYSGLSLIWVYFSLVGPPIEPALI